MAEVASAPIPGGSALTLPLALPSTLHLPALSTALASTNPPKPIDEAYLRAPDEALVLHLYSTILQLPALREASAALEREKAERARRDIEVEEALNEAESVRTEAEERAERERAERERAEAEKDRLAAELAGSNAQLAALKSTSESGTSEVAELKGRLEQVEQEKRDLLSSLEKEREESSRRGEEIESLSVRNREARQEISRLSTELQESRSVESAGKFKIQSLEQELVLARKDAEWAHSELSRANESSAAFRREKHAETVRLQSELDSAQQAASSATSKLSSLQNAYDTTAARLTESTKKVSELTARLAQQEDSFRQEMATQGRLVNLLERRAEDAQRRIDEVESQWETVLEQCREREEAARAEAAAERDRRERVEMEKEEIQIALDRLAEGVGIESGGLGGQNGDMQVADDSVSGYGGSLPSTPRRGPSVGPIGTPVGMSPTAALASRVQKSGKTFTQVYTELARTQEELRREKVEVNRLGGVLAQVMDELQERAPGLQAQREETERLSIDLAEMSGQLARACEERDAAEQSEKASRLSAESVQRENGILQQQLADLGRQVRALTRELVLRDDPSAAARLADDGSALEEMDGVEGPVQDASDTAAVITAQLVTFRSLSELCSQNARLLRVTRELGARMESEERNYRTRLEANESEAVAEARELIVQLREEVQGERLRSEGVKRERDMFRRMCASGGASGAVPHVGAEDGATGAAAGLAAQYATLQSQFEAYKTETSQDTQRLKDDIQAARNEAGAAAVQAAREKAGREAGEERYRTLQQSYELQRSELAEINKRSQALHDNLARRDIASHAIEEQLLEARSAAERLRNEAANLRAEKELWKGVENRLVEENRQMIKERGHLNELMRNMQSMQNELERSTSESRRRLERQVQLLETTNAELKEKVSSETEQYRQLSLRREVEVKELHARIDKASSDLASTHEALAVAKTSQEHLQARADDLAKQVDAKEEKLAVYEKRTTSSGATSAGQTLSREQQLEIELADLRGELRTAQVEIEQANAHVEQYKAIAQANEEALAQLQSTYDEYKLSTDSSIAAKDSELHGLRERLENIASELTTAQTESSQLRQQLDAQRSEFAQEKKSLEDAIADMNTVEERAKADQEDVRADVRKQAQLAREAHAKYEQELVAHAEDVKALSSIKEQLAQAQNAVREAQTAAETAQANLTGSQASWESQKASIEKEVGDLRKRIDDLTSQNGILHQHLESISSQATQIRQAATNPATANVADGDTSLSGQASDELHEVIKYLRREKEIVDLQMELNKQECARLRQSLEHANRTLDETRVQLAEERARGADAASSATQHAELLEKINQLSILRESNATLRDEAERSVRRAASLEQQLTAATAELDPLREQLRTAHVELEACQAQLRLVQEDNARWQARTQQILQKYDRIDPAELQRLEERAKAAEEALEKQKQEASKELDTIKEEAAKTLEQVQAQVEEQKKLAETHRASLQTSMQTSRSKFDELRNQSLERIRTLNGTIATLRAEIEELKKEKEANASASTQSGANEVALSELRAERDRLQQEKAALEAALAEQQAQAPASEMAPAGATEEERQKWEEEKKTLVEARERAEKREQMHLAKAREMNREKKTAQEALAQANKEREEAINKIKEEFAGNNSEAIDKAVQERLAQQVSAEPGQIAQAEDNEALLLPLRQKVVEQEETLRQAEARVNELQAKLDNSGPPGDASTQAAIDQLQKKHAEELKLQETNLLEQHQKQLKEAVEAAVIKIKESAGAGTGANGGVNAEDIEMRIQERLSAVEKEREAEQAQAIQAAVEAREQALKAEHQAALQARYNTAHEEARLRNQVMIKMKDAKIEKLNAQLAELKGEGPGTGMPGQAKPAVVTSAAPVAPGVPTAPAAAPASNAAAGPSRPAVAQIGRGGAAVARGGVPAGRGRGGVPASPTLPQRPNAGAGPTDGQAAAPQGAAARGGANAQGRGAPRGRGRGGALQAATAAAAAAAPGAPGANAAKRKLDQGVTSTAANGEGDGGNAAKRVKPAGAPVAINRPPVQRPGGGGSPGAGGNQRATGA